MQNRKNKTKHTLKRKTMIIKMYLNYGESP